MIDGGGFHDIGLAPKPARAEWVWRSHLVAHERARVSTLIWPQRFTCRLGILHELCLDRDLSTLNSKHFSDKYAHPLKPISMKKFFSMLLRHGALVDSACIARDKWGNVQPISRIMMTVSG